MVLWEWQVWCSKVPLRPSGSFTESAFRCSKDEDLDYPDSLSGADTLSYRAKWSTTPSTNPGQNMKRCAQRPL